METYSNTQKRLHWITVAIILVIVPLGFFMDGVPEKYLYFGAFLHLILGTALFVTSFLRLCIHYKYKRPAYPKEISKLSQLIAKSVQYCLLLILLIQPLIGAVFFWNYPPNKWHEEKDLLVYKLYEAHEMMAYALIGLITLHVLGYLKHLVFDKTDLLGRIK